jgi:hypothetical protein
MVSLPASPSARRLLVAGLVGLASCEGADYVSKTSLSIIVSDETPVVGDSVGIEVRAEGLGALDLSTDSALLLEPKGVLELQPDGLYSAVGAGTVVITLSTREVVVSRSVTVACPPAGGASAIDHPAEVITSDTTWEGSRTHRVNGRIDVDSGALTIGACSRLEMAAGASIVVGQTQAASLIARGTREFPIVMEGAPDAGGPATWEGIQLYLPMARSSVLRWVTLRNAAGVSSVEGRAVVDVVGDGRHMYSNAPLIVRGVRIEGDGTTGCLETGLRVRDLFARAALDWSENHIEGCGGVPVSVDATSMGAVPAGTFIGNAINEIECTGGWTGASYQLWRNPGIPYRVRTLIRLEEAPLAVEGELYDTNNDGLFAEVEAGTVFRFDPDAGLILGPGRARLSTYGTREHPIIFTSSQANPQPGDWAGILISQAHSAGRPAAPARFRGAIIEYAGRQSEWTPAGGIVILSQTFITSEVEHTLLEGSTVRWNAGYGLAAVQVVPTASLSASFFGTFRPSLRGLPGCICGNVVAPVGPPNVVSGAADDSQYTTCLPAGGELLSPPQGHCGDDSLGIAAGR